MSEEAAGLLATTRYVGPEPEVDEHGMPIVGPDEKEAARDESEHAASEKQRRAA